MGKKTEILNSNIFKFGRYRYQSQLKVEKVKNPKIANSNNSSSNNNGSYPELNKLYIRVQCMSPVRKRIPLEVCFLRGPDFGYKLEPIQFECEMTKNCRDSKWIEMIPNNMLFNDEEIKSKFFTNYQTENKMNLRVIVVDKRANGPSNSFGGINDHFDEVVNDDFEGADFLSDDAENFENENNNGSGHGSSTYSSTSSSTTSSRTAEFTASDDDDMYSDLDEYSVSDSDDGYY